MKPEEIYLQHLRTIERIAAFVARRRHLDSTQAEEFVQEVRVRLLDNDYAIIRKFKGRSVLSTYLTTVIGRLFSQWRVEQWGKWRPSAEAKRLGPKAVELERLLWRDGYTWPEALRILTTPGSSRYTVRELEAIYLRLPSRSPRPVMMSEAVMPEVPVEPDAYDRIEARDRERTKQTAVAELDRVIATMDAEDQVILKMLFWDDRTVSTIARTLNLDQKKLYKRLDKLYQVLRRELEKAGVRPADVAGLLNGRDE
jgi:RNA polymerase sigma factor (sigma-70 family)